MVAFISLSFWAIWLSRYTRSWPNASDFNSEESCEPGLEILDFATPGAVAVRLMFCTYPESQWPIIMGYFQSIMGHFGV